MKQNEYVPFLSEIVEVIRHTEIEYTFRIKYLGEDVYKRQVQTLNGRSCSAAMPPASERSLRPISRKPRPGSTFPII